MAGRPLVAVSSASFAKNATLLAELEALGADVVANKSGHVLEGAPLAAFLGDAVIAVIGTEMMTPAVLDACPKLRFLAKYGVGLDNVDEAELSRRGIGLGWTAGVNRRSVAELALGFALGHVRNIVPSVLRLKAGQWVKDGGRQLSDMQVGIVGFGHTGSDFARLLGAFGSRLVYAEIADRSVAAKALGAQLMGYEELVATSDVISFHVPLTPATRGMFGVREIAAAKTTALVINTSRGTVVDFDAACQAVVDGRLGGFAADVFPQEPCDLTHWAGCERLYFTPHIGGNATEAVLAMGRSAIEAVRAYVSR